jgi:hypothetical protein
MVDVERGMCDFFQIREEERYAGSDIYTNMWQLELERFVTGSKPLAAHEKKIPINVGRSVFSE